MKILLYFTCMSCYHLVGILRRDLLTLTPHMSCFLAHGNTQSFTFGEKSFLGNNQGCQKKVDGFISISCHDSNSRHT